MQDQQQNQAKHGWGSDSGSSPLDTTKKATAPQIDDTLSRAAQAIQQARKAMSKISIPRSCGC